MISINKKKIKVKKYNLANVIVYLGSKFIRS